MRVCVGSAGFLLKEMIRQFWPIWIIGETTLKHKTSTRWTAQTR
jgi:hypothetical protein